MSNVKKIMMVIASALIIALVGKSVLLQEGSTSYFIAFFFVGAGLAGLRLFINMMIGKMKGKPVVLKVGFFAALLSVGLPFQNWFRKEVILSMDSTVMLPSIAILVSSVVLMTIVYGQVPAFIVSLRNKKGNLI